MVKYICKKCGTEFSQKSHYDKHLTKKNPCKDKQELIDNLVTEKVNEKMKELVPQFGELSKELTKNLDKSIKKDKGIFFTPFNIIKKSFDLVFEYCNEHNIKITDILEPSCGSCEYIKFIDYQLYNVNIDGIEYDNTIYDSINEIDFGTKNNIKLSHMDYLKYDNDNDKKYDLIIGNPPYFVIKKGDVKKEYNKYYDGRPNIFIIFIIHSLFKLKESGILMFILPKSFCNCLYYNKLRSHINNNYKIINIVDCSNERYLDTSQDTIIFSIINMKGNNDKFIYNNNGNILFNTPENIVEITKLYDNSTTLNKLNFNVKVGDTVWNQCKDILTDDNKYTRLIYSGDIKDNKLVLTKYKDDKKKNYIKSEGYKKPILVVNRGYGVGNYSFTYTIIDIDEEYLIENHLIIIRSNEDISKEELLIKYNMIIKSFENNKTKEFIKLYCCNSALNTKELQNILPIYL